VSGLTPELLDRLRADYPDSEFISLDNFPPTDMGKCKHAYRQDGEENGLTHWICAACGLGTYRFPGTDGPGTHEPRPDNLPS